MIQIPLRSDLDNYEFSVDIDSITYLFEIQWNTRNEQWCLIVKNEAGDVLVGSVPLLVNYSLLGRFKLNTLPQGVLFLFDTSGRYADPAKADLGNRCILLYEANV
jgi:hypothetical protein